MLLWVCILFGGLTAYLLRGRSLYANWTTLFNVGASIYISVMLAPFMLVLLAEGTQWQGYHCAGFVLLSSVILFVILEIVAAYAIVVEDVDISFPRALEFVGSKAAGFVAGFCTCGLVLFIVTVIVMQYDYKPWMKLVRTEDRPVTVATMPVEKTCNAINYFSLQCYPTAPKNVIDKLTSLKNEKRIEPKVEEDTPKYPDLLTPGK